jgi:predicted dehydrogenase
MGMENPTLGIVGLGNHGRLLTDYLVDEPVGLVGFDASDELRQNYESEYEIPTFPNIEFSQNSDVDGVIVTLPNSLHADVAIQALEKDIDVLVEKPLAASVSGIERVRTVATESNAHCLVDLYHRHVPAARLLRSVVQEGELGTVEFVDARFTRRHGVPAYGSWLTSKEIAGGGVLMDLGIHVLDLLLWLLGFPDVTAVDATLGESNRAYNWTELEEFATDRELGSEMFDVEDRAFLTIEIDDGPTVALETAWADGQPDEHSYRFNGTEGAAKLDITNLARNPELWIRRTDDDPIDHYVDKRLEAHDSPNPQRAMLEHFMDVVTGNSEPEQRFEEHLAVHRIIEDCYR